MQWLSASGAPEYSDVFHELLHRGNSSWPQIERSFLDADRLTQGGFSRRFFDRLDMTPGERIHPDKQAAIASSLQEAVNETIAGVFGTAENVCLAGGLALNAILIASLERRFPRVFVQPAAGNAGTALGAAFQAWHGFYGQEKRIPFDTLCLGPGYSAEQIKRVLENCKLRFRYISTEGELIEQAIHGLEQS